MSKRRHSSFRRPALEALEGRAVPAVLAFFSPLGGALTVIGDHGDNAITVSRDPGGNLLVNGGQVAILGGTPTAANTSLITVFGLEGNDTIRLDQANGPLPGAFIFGGGGHDDITAGAGNDVVYGGFGNDTMRGGPGVDIFFGQQGDDFVDGDQGNDIALLGDGNDVFQWDPGDGSDRIEGEAGTDTMLFNGSAGNEIFDASANGSRLRFFRNLGNIVMDTDDVEVVTLNALGGTDTVTINDLSATDVRTVNVNLGADGAADRVVVNGTAGNDVVQANNVGGVVQVTGLAAQVNVSGSEAANDALVLNGLGGNDTLSGGALAALIHLTLDGGEGDDTLNGGNGADILIGGFGHDFIDGNAGADTAFMGDGNDVFQWDPGDGSDVVEGQAGSDTLLFNGSNGAEVFDASANGGRLRFFRNLGNIVMDVDDVERLDLTARGGGDIATINDLSGTDVVEVNIDLGLTPGGAADGVADQVIINATEGDDGVAVSGGAGRATIAGLAATINVRGAEAIDSLTINARGGEDAVDASGVTDGSFRLFLNGGAGGDVLIGGAGDDVLDGGEGEDVLIGGPGIDTGLNGEVLIDIEQ